MENILDIKILTCELVESFRAVSSSFWDDASEDLYMQDMYEKAVADMIEKWQNSEVEDLKKTPMCAVEEYFKSNPSFEDAKYLYNKFAVGIDFDVPHFITENFLSFGEAEQYVFDVVENMDLNIDGDNNISVEDNERLCTFFAVLSLVKHMKSDSLTEKVMTAFQKCPEENFSISECLCQALFDLDCVGKMIEFINNANSLGIKEETVLQMLVKQPKCDAIYYCIKGCLKKDSPDLGMIAQIAADYNDGRIIPILRKTAKKMLAELYAKNLTPYMKCDESNEFFVVCNAISRLGGSVEDLLTN